MDLAAQGRKIDRIAREAKVTWRTAKAVLERETRQIAERKQELLDQSLRIARRAANKIEEKLDGAPLNQLIPAFGVAIDKVAILSADPFTEANQQHLHLQLQAVDLIGSFNKYLYSIGTVNSPNNSSDGFPIPSDWSPMDIYSKEKALEDRCATEELPRSTMLKPAKNRIEPRRS